MNVFFHELKQYRNSTIVWIVALVAVASLYLSLYNSIASNPAFNDVYQNFPEAFKKTFDIQDITVFSGLYGLVLNLVLLTGAVQAMNLGTGIASKEVRERTADFLLTRPISRASVLRQKLLTVFLLIVITDVVFIAAGWGMIRALIGDPISFGTYLTSTSSLFLLQIFFLVLGFLVGSAMKRIKTVIAVSLPVVFAFYVISLFDTIVGEKIRFFTPFKFFDVNSLAAGAGYDAWNLAYEAVLVVAAVAASFFIYRRKDIPTL